MKEVRFADGRLDEEDGARKLGALAAAGDRADYVIASPHNHQSGEDMAVTELWARRLAQQRVDAGADVFIAH